MRKRVYLSGPMTGYPNLNQEEFGVVEKAWKTRGWEVVNPAASPERIENLKGDIREIIKVDVSDLLSCHAIALLPFWWQSAGALTEFQASRWAGIPAYNAITFEPVHGHLEFIHEK